MRTVRRLAERARAAGARDRRGRRGHRDRARRRVGWRRCETSRGRIRCERLAARAGPVGARADARRDRARRATWPPISYWKAQEGEFELPRRRPPGPRAGREPPVVHLDQAGPLRSDRDGSVLVAGPWGIYFRVGAGGATVTGGGLPVAARRARPRPLRPRQPRARGRAGLRRLLHLGPRRGGRPLPRPRRRLAHDARRRDRLPHPDNYPICDWVAPNAYAIVDSGHGFKLLALGRLAADEVLDGEDAAPSSLVRARMSRLRGRRRDAPGIESGADPECDRGHALSRAARAGRASRRRAPRRRGRARRAGRRPGEVGGDQLGGRRGRRPRRARRRRPRRRVNAQVPAAAISAAASATSAAASAIASGGSLARAERRARARRVAAASVTAA